MKRTPKEPGDSDKQQRRTRDVAAMDITSALRGWEFQSGQVNVRLIRGKDGKPKLQMRLDLGLLQMELDGRPDGKRPHKNKTELDFQRRRLTQHLSRHGSDRGFGLSPRDCQALREESAMFYHRYLSLFVLEQYQAVIRDTQHNIDVLDLCRKYGRDERDRESLEQYRPYIMMMNARAKACESLRQGYVQTALAYLKGGIKQIARFHRKAGKPEQTRRSHEAHILLDMIRQIRRQLPPDPRVEIQRKLADAVKAERYEEAADLRDRLLAMQHGPTDTPPSVTQEIAEQPVEPAPKRKKPERRRKRSDD